MQKKKLFNLTTTMMDTKFTSLIQTMLTVTTELIHTKKVLQIRLTTMQQLDLKTAVLIWNHPVLQPPNQV
jgi:hypothetical protein